MSKAAAVKNAGATGASIASTLDDEAGIELRWISFASERRIPGKDFGNEVECRDQKNQHRWEAQLLWRLRLIRITYFPAGGREPEVAYFDLNGVSFWLK